MAVRRARIVLFDRWTDDAAALPILDKADNIDVERLRYDDDEGHNWSVMRTAHGYQISARVELREPWYATRDLIARTPELLAVSSTGSGYDVIDVGACTRAGIIVCNQTGSNARAVAEHAVGLMLTLSKRIVTTDRIVRAFEGADRLSVRGNNLEGKTVGIIGLGNIGRITAAICSNGFGMEVLAYDPYLTEAEIVARGAVPATWRDVFTSSDFVSVHCPRNDETFGRIGREEFDLMKPSAFFINTARGGIHREDDLVEALRAKRIAGAGLDVFLHEPPSPDHPLMQFDEVVANPHVAGMTTESLTQMSVYAASQWLDIFSGKVPPRLVNPEAWVLYSRRFEDAFGFAPDPLPSTIQ